MLVNHEKKEYVAWKHCNLSVKEWTFPTHGLFIAWVMQHSHWRYSPCVLLSDAGTEDEYNEIYDGKYKDVELEMVKEFNNYIKDKFPENQIQIEEQTLE